MSSPDGASQRAPSGKQHHSLVLQQQRNPDGCWTVFRYAGKEWDTRGGEETAERHVYYECKTKTRGTLVPTMYMLMYTESMFKSWRHRWERFVEKLSLPLLYLDFGGCVRHQKPCGWCWCELTDNKSCSVWWRMKESCKGSRTLTACGRSCVLCWVYVGMARDISYFFGSRISSRRQCKCRAFFREES